MYACYIISRMSYDDVCKYFEYLEFCHLTPDAHTKEAAIDTVSYKSTE